MAEIDRLTIKLTADASSAKRSVNALVQSLEALNRALGSLDVGNLNNFTHVVNKLADSVSALNSGTSAIRETARAFNELDKASSSVRKAKQATDELSNTSTSLMVVKSAITDVATVSYSLMNVFGNMESAFSGISGGTKRLIDDMGVIDTTFRNIDEPINQLATTLNTLATGFREVINVIYSISGPNQKLIEESNVIDTTFREIVDPIGVAGQAMEEYAQKQDRASQSTQNLADNMKEVQEEALREAPQTDVGERQVQSANRANAAIQTLKAGYEGFTVVLKKVGSMFATVARKVTVASLSFKGFGKVAKNAIDHIPRATDLAKKFGKEITRVGKMLKLMVTRMALRQVISEVGNGFKSLALHSEQFNQSVSGMMNASKKLGYSFAAMVSPLINALAPAIQYVISLLTKLANAINQVFSSLSGATTFNKAKDFAENWADNIKAANKEAKQLKKTVLGFDELNQLQEKQSGGDTSGNIVDMFDTEKIDPKWKKIADWLKEMWELGDFTELGAALGRKLRDLLESIPWDKIRQTANKLGGALATLINGFVEVERLGYDIGYTIAQSVNTVFEFLNGFVHKLHWDSIGKFIADTFNGFFENIDWPLIKDTVVTGMAGLAETIQTFIEEFHWDNISTTIINGVDTIVSGVRAFVEGIEWFELGQKMGEQITKSIEGIDWYDMGVALGDIIQAAVDWVSGMLDTMPSVETLIQKATDLMNGLFDQVSFEEMGANLAIIFNNVYDFLTGFWDENGDTIKEKVKEFFKGFWDNVDKEDLKDVLGKILDVAVLGAIAYALGAFTKLYVTTKLKALITGAAGSAEVTAAASAAGTSIGTLIKTGIIGAIAIGLGNELIELVQGGWSNLIIKGMQQAGYSESEIESKRKDLEYLEERYDGLSGKVQLFKDAFTGMKDVKLPSEEIDNLTIKVEDLRTPVIKIRDDFDQFGKKTKTNTGDAKKAVGDLKIEVVKDSDTINKSVNAINFKPLKDNISTLDGDTKKAFTGLATAGETFARTINRDTKAGFDSVSLNAKVVTEDLPLEFAGAQTEISGTLNTLVLDTDDSMNEIQTSVDTSMDEVIKSFDTVKKAMDKKEWTFQGVADGLGETFRRAKEAIKKEWNEVAKTLNGEHEVGSAKVKIDLPKFAYGGFPKDDSLFLANSSEMLGKFSNGRNVVANNQQIVEGISAGVYNAVSSAMARSNSNSNGNGYIANTIIVDGEVIARTVTKAQQRQNMRYSPSMG